MTTPEPGKNYWAVEHGTGYQRPLYVKRVEFGMAYCTQWPGVPLEIRVDEYDWQATRSAEEILSEIMGEATHRVTCADILQEVPDVPLP